MDHQEQEILHPKLTMQCQLYQVTKFHNLIHWIIYFRLHWVWLLLQRWLLLPWSFAFILFLLVQEINSNHFFTLDTHTVESVQIGREPNRPWNDSIELMKSVDKKTKSESADDLIQVTNDEFQYCHTHGFSHWHHNKLHQLNLFLD